MRASHLGAFAMALLVGAQAGAQSGAEPSAIAVPAAPAFARERLIAIEMPPFMRVHVGVDPQTLQHAADGSVRYVVVFQGDGDAFSALFEAIRCESSEVITYARSSGSAHWKPVTEPQWRDFRDHASSRHAWALARQGVCDGRAPVALTEVADRLRKPLSN